MKKFFFLFIAALAAVSAGAQTTIDGIRYNLNDEDGTAEVDKYKYYVTGDLTGALIIPETVEYGGKAYRVTSLAAQAFRNGHFQSAVIPNSVTKIASGAFFECKKLQSVRLPENLATIEPMVFYNCESLAAIEFLKNLRSIKSEAFIGCQSLTSIFIPKNVSEIGGQPTEPAFWLVVDGHPFKGCLNISSIAVDEENATFDSRDGLNVIIETATGKTFAITLTVPDEDLEEYARTYPWNTFATIMGFSGKTIEPDYQDINAPEYTRDARKVSRYAVDGRRLTSPRKGVNIIRMPDGTISKVMER